ncbi:MAG TPA: alpha-glucan family phosphorylase, partial [Longimicrobiales bacterium]|nr:alpha-glucan family phosphorylase [Longimicrobiales bacterium]
ITNGVHLPTWVYPTMARLYARYVDPDWRMLPSDEKWAAAIDIPNQEIWAARRQMREHMVVHIRNVLAKQVARRGGDASGAANALDPEALTIVFARRFATYKRATLLLAEPQRLLDILHNNKVQFVFAGKAHPKDEPGKELLRQIYEFGMKHGVADKFMFVEEYDVALARFLTSGADVWLNVPRKPYEASGTSGMKAAANGALNLSIPDGWWAEAWDEHNNLGADIGWSIDAKQVGAGQDRADADALYSLLENSVVPLFFERDHDGVANGWCERVKSSIAQVVPFFNTHRMVREYVKESYLPAFKASAATVDHSL